MEYSNLQNNIVILTYKNKSLESERLTYCKEKARKCSNISIVYKMHFDRHESHNIFEVIDMSKASAYFILENVNTKHDIKEIKRELDAIPGVISVSAAQGEQKIAVDYDTTGTNQQALQKRLCKLGYQVQDSLMEEHIM